jgi:hypothetical protein
MADHLLSRGGPSVRGFVGMIALVVVTGCGGGSSSNSGSTPPVPPTAVTAVDGDGEVQLSWTASPGATSFKVLRASTENGTYELRGTPKLPSFTDTAPNGVASFYAVQAVNDAGPGAPSAPVRVVPYPVCLTSGEGLVTVIRQGHERGPPLRQFGNLTGIVPVVRDITINPIDDELVIGQATSTTPDAVLTFPRSATGNVRPKRRLAVQGTSMALDSRGTIFVTAATERAIRVYDASIDGGAIPLRTIRGPSTNFRDALRLAVNGSSGELVVFNPSLDPAAARLETYSLADLESSGPEDLPPLRSISGPGLFPSSSAGALAVDELHDEIAVLDDSGIVTFDAFDDGNSVIPKRQMTLPGFFQPMAMVIDAAHDEIRVAGLFHDADPNSVNAGVWVVPRLGEGAQAPLRVLIITGSAWGLSAYPSALALDGSRDELIVADQGRILAYDRAATGNAAPKRSLSGEDSGLMSPGAIVANRARGELTVMMGMNGITFTTYSRLASGAALPLRSFSTTDLFSPGVMYLDELSDELFIPFSNALRVYSRTSVGANTSPVRSVNGATVPTLIAGFDHEIVLAGLQPVGLVRIDGRDGTVLSTLTSSGLTGDITGLATDRLRNEIAVQWSNYDEPNGAVRIFGRFQGGDVVARRVITSRSHQIGVSTINEVTGEIWTVSATPGILGEQIAIFPPDAGIDAEPTRVIDVRALGIGSITGLTFCP